MLQMLLSVTWRLRTTLRVALMSPLDARPAFLPASIPSSWSGAAPAGCRTSYCLKRARASSTRWRPHRRRLPRTGCSVKWPIYQRLLSWTKPDAPVDRGSRAYEWYDHNSLLSERRDRPAGPRVAEFMDPHVDGSFPPGDGGRDSRRSRTGPESPFGTAAIGSRRAARRTVSSWSRRTASTGAGSRVFAIGAHRTRWKMPIPGIENVPHYVETGKTARRYEVCKRIRRDRQTELGL